MPEFRKFPSIPRWKRNCTITEKIDGTNACVVVEEFPFGWHVGGVDDDGVSHDLPEGASFVFSPQQSTTDGLPDKEYLVYAQSRTRLIRPGKSTDNHGFAGWAWDNATALANVLGAGYHYGEWWGSGVNRGYGLVNGEKRFSLFNTGRYDPSLLWLDGAAAVPEMSVVPVLYTGQFQDSAIYDTAAKLRLEGSVAAPGYMNPEGIVVYHHASRSVFKYTLDGDAAKGSQ